MSFSKKNLSAINIAKKELKKQKKEKHLLSFFLCLTAIGLSFLFVFLLYQASLNGYSSYVDSQAGTITELTLYRKYDTSYWNGIYGLALRVSDFTEQLYETLNTGEIVRMDLFFDCLASDSVGGNEVYAANSSVINFNNLVPASISDLDNYVGCSGAIDCPSNTFTDTMSIMVGGTNITNIPSTYTYKWDGDNGIYNIGALHDGSQFVFVTNVQDIQRSFNQEKIVNFQMLLPIPEDSSETFYFFTDPNDECPASGGIGDNIVSDVSGYVYDSFGNPIENVTITIAGVSDNSSSEGFYSLNFTVVPGEYNFFASKYGYDNYFSTVNISFTNYSWSKNFSMEAYTPGAETLFNVNVWGYTFTSSNSVLGNVKIILGDSYVYSNDTTGFFNVSSYLALGNHSLVAIKDGYDNYHVSIDFNESGSYHRNVSMEQVSVEYPFLTGPYTEEPKDSNDNPPVEEVLASGEDYWISAKEIRKEVRKDTFVEESVGIYNLRTSGMSLSFDVSSEIDDFVKIDKSVATLSPDESLNLKVTLYGTQPLGSYEGKITVSGDIEQEIPVYVTVVDKKFSVEVLLLELDLLKSTVQPGDTLDYKLNLQNLLRDQNYEVVLDTRVRNLEDDSVYEGESFEVEIDQAHTALRKFELPDNLTSGDYLLEVTANYLGSFSGVTASFIVSKPIYLYSFFGIPLWLIFSIISFLGFVALNLFMYKNYKDKKKRYKIQLDMHTLPQPGERVVKMGKIAESNHPAYYEIDRLTTHAIVAGATGMGKSISAQVMVEEVLKQNIGVIVFDPTAQWSGMLRKCTDKKMMSFYPKFGLKPQDAQAFKGNIRMVKNERQVIDIEKHINPGQIQIFSLNKLDPSKMDVFVANVIRQIFGSSPKESPNLKVLLVFDEVHRLLAKFGGSGEGFLQIERACREFRKWGIGVLLISQVLNDFVGEIKANINTELQTRTLEEGDLERIKTKYGEEFLKSLVRSEVGVVMFQNSEYNRGKPYFVNFRPILHNTRRLSDEELEKYNDYNDKVDDLEFQIDELEKEKVDTFDLKMELKLVKDKIMSGSFSVVEIYLEGLKPRVEKEWEKLGKKAPERKLELVSHDEIKKSIAEAKEERSKATAKEEVKKVEEKVVEDSESETENVDNKGEGEKLALKKVVKKVPAKVPVVKKKVVPAKKIVKKVPKSEPINKSEVKFIKKEALKDEKI